MKRLLPVALFALAFFLPRFAHAEVIHDFQVKATLTSERRFEVTETISYDFEDEEHHGIYRNIPVRYDRDGANYRLRLTDVSATMDGEKATIDISKEGDDEIIRIGDANKYVTGKHVYTIHYVTDRAVNFFDDHSEIYWNVTGDQWAVPIEKSSFSITLPDEIRNSNASTTCFTGPYGSTEADCTVSSVGNTVSFTATRVLLTSDGFTVVVGIPKGIIQPPTAAERITQFLVDNGVLAIPVIVFIAMFMWWWRLGRDPEVGTVIAEYEAPQKLLPHEVAAARENGDVPLRGVTAAILEMARAGYLHIRFGEKKGLLFGSTKTYTLVKVKKTNDGLDAPSKILFDGLFEEGDEIGTDQFKDQKVYTYVAEFKKAAKEKLQARKLFSTDWYNSPSLYLVVGFLLMWGAGFIGAGIPLFTFSCFVSGIIVIIFGFVMPKRTAVGTEVLRKLKGFELFMSVAEKDRIKFHNAPQQSPQQFLSLLPFAIALGVERQWAEQFKDMEITPPDWAEGYHPGTGYWASSFVGELQSVHSAAASGYAAPSSGGSGGSGFSGGGSGGGMGGGGGGSW